MCIANGPGGSHKPCRVDPRSFHSSVAESGQPNRPALADVPKSHIALATRPLFQYVLFFYDIKSNHMWDMCCLQTWYDLGCLSRLLLASSNCFDGKGTAPPAFERASCCTTEIIGLYLDRPKSLKSSNTTSPILALVLPCQSLANKNCKQQHPHQACLSSSALSTEAEPFALGGDEGG